MKMLMLLVLGYHLVVSAYSFYLYGLDKRRSVLGGRRVPEKTLHTVDLMGGWFGGLAARRLLAHKTAKRRFVVGFWLSAVGHVAVCAGLLMMVSWMAR